MRLFDKVKFSHDDHKNREIKKTIFCIIMVVISTIIYSLGVIWFINPAHLYSGGVTGIAQLIVNFVYKLTEYKLDLGILVFVLNIPILIYGFRAVSKRFVLCSIISIGLQTIIMSNVVSPYLMIPALAEFDDTLLLAFMGGFVCGLGSALALRYGTSTGGIDVLAQAIAFKGKISIGYLSLLINVLIAIVGGILYGSALVCFYTIVRIIAQSVITDRVHTSYNFLKVEIVCEKGEEVSQLLMADIQRGVTILSGKGAYTHNNKAIIDIVVSSYEVNKVIDDAKKIDSTIFVTVTPVKNVFGNFAKRTIA